MKIDLKLFYSNSSNFSKEKIASLIAHIWQKIHMLLFFVLLFAAIIFGGYIWQQNLYGEGWSAERKQEYTNTQNREVLFKENDFQKVLDDIQARKDENAKEYQPIKGIFKPY